MLLVERVLNEAEILESDRTKLPTGVLCRVKYPICNIDELNANKRRYSRELWERVQSDPNISEQMGNRALFGHAEHPEHTQSDLQLTSHVIFEMNISEDGRVYQTMDIVDTPTGRIVNTLLLAGCKVGVSTRAEGELKEARDDQGEMFYDVVPESYKYKTTDFTADPSTHGAIPIDIKRNVVEAIGQEADNEKNKVNERAFAKAVLDSMGEKTVEPVTEETVTVSMNPEIKQVRVDGDVESATISGDVETILVDANSVPPGMSVSVTVKDAHSDSTALGGPEGEVVAETPPEDTELVPEEEEEEEEHDMDGELNAGEPKPEDEDRLGKPRVKNESKTLKESVRFFTHDEYETKLGSGEIEPDNVGKKYAIPENFDLDKFVEVLGPPTNDQPDFMEWVGEIDGNQFLLTLRINSNLFSIGAIGHETVRDVEEWLSLEFQWDLPAAVDVPNESKVSRRMINRFRVQEAILKEEAARLFKALDDGGNQELQSRIVVKRLQGVVDEANQEVALLRSKLEDKARLASEAKKQVSRLTSKIKSVNEKYEQKVVKLGKEIQDRTRSLNESKSEVESTKVEYEAKIRLAVSEATKVVVKQYTASQVKMFGSVHDNVRALLEDCMTIQEVDAIINEYRESKRRGALHQPIDEMVIVNTERQPRSRTRRMVGKVFEGMTGISEG